MALAHIQYFKRIPISSSLSMQFILGATLYWVCFLSCFVVLFSLFMEISSIFIYFLVYLHINCFIYLAISNYLLFY
jgi:hypothetical protein